MGISELAAAKSAQRGLSRDHFVLAVFTLTIFLSATLLFAVQPMFTKMVLPRLGGTPAVWSVAMVFFQTALLAGYAYAHLLTRYVPTRTAIIIHLVVMLATSFTLPLAIAMGWGRPPASGEAFWLLGLFAASIGLPFFALAANGPLLQAWFARTDHPAAKAPYFLYAASNLGSFLALLSYPLAIEPFIRLSEQTRIWSLGFYGLIVLIASCGTLLWRSSNTPALFAGDSTAELAPPNWQDALVWTVLAGIPAGLLLAVTAHISTDVAAVPLLWVLPLALYLLTFVIVFQTRPIIPHWLVVGVQPFFIFVLLVQFFDPAGSIVGAIAIHVSAFFVFALVCHGELARRRPAPKYLTAFYFWMSAGGAIGGIAVGLIAPHVFNWVMEYPILIVLAVLCRPGLALPDNSRDRYLLLGAMALSVVVLFAWSAYGPDLDKLTFKVIVAVLLATTVLFWRAPLPFAAIVAFVLAFNHIVWDTGYVARIRSFFAVHKVYDADNGTFRVLMNGTTLHGAQRIRDATGKLLTGRPEVDMYYYDGSAMAQVMDAVRARVGGPIHYAVIGLGAGSLACRAKSSDTVYFYEIDPTIVRIARDPALFTFLSECRPNVPIVLGDARLTLADAPDRSYDIIYDDAFSSDAIPVHLLTREAMALYFKKLAPHGIVVMHVSNRNLELASVVAGIAAANGLVTRLSQDDYTEADSSQYKLVGAVAVVARDDQDFGTLAKSSYWVPQKPDPKQWVWTDDYSNIIGSILRKLRQSP
jgi:hypothetical protein